MGGAKPAVVLPPLWENIPSELQAYPQWVLYRFELRADKKGEQKWTKPPYQPDGSNAKADDPSTWSPFDFVQTAYETAGTFDGIGFVLSNSDPFVGFDFDDCLDGNFVITDPRVAEYVARLDSYTEISPSLTGLRVIVRAELPAIGRKKGPFECYDNGRYLTITGNVFPRA